MGATGSLPDKAIREQLRRILATPEFANFPRSGAFLNYVVEQTLAGHKEDLKESVIGVEVFGREPGYDPKSDSVVRTQARRVREKLKEYYDLRGQQDPVHIEVPKGRYVPEFRLAPVARPPERSRLSQPRSFVSIGAVACLAAAVSLGFVAKWHTPRESTLRAVAVLPVADLDSARRFDALAEGLTEDLERDLSRIHDLRVHGHPPDGLTEAQRTDYASLGSKLAVGTLIDGRVVTEAGHSEIQFSLVRSSDGTLLWADHFPATAAVGPMEHRIEAGIANALGVMQPAGHAENPQAHDLFFAGRTLWATRDPVKCREAIRLFEQAVGIDPGYALAYMGIADTYAMMAANDQIETKTALERGLPAVRKALELDPYLAEAHAALAVFECLQRDFKAGDAEYQRAIELNPNYDRAYEREGVLRMTMGDFPGGERLLLESERLNPYAMALPLIRAELYYYWRRYDESEALIRVVLKADPKNVTAFQLLARDYMQQNEPGRAVDAERTAVEQYPDQLLFQAELASYLYRAGDTAEAAQRIERVLHPKAPGDIDPLAVAMMYARMKNKESTLRYLQIALAEHTGDLPSIRWEPALDFVRADPRFQAVAAAAMGPD